MFDVMEGKKKVGLKRKWHEPQASTWFSTLPSDSIHWQARHILLKQHILLRIYEYLLYEDLCVFYRKLKYDYKLLFRFEPKCVHLVMKMGLKLHLVRGETGSGFL